MPPQGVCFYVVMPKFAIRAFAVFLVALLATFAVADTFDQQVASVLILQLKPVQRELGVTAQQRAAMNKYADAHRAKLKTYYQEASKAGQKTVDQQKLLGFYEEMKKGVLDQLSAVQIKRLREISLQTLDFTALADTLVGTEVGLNDAQQKRVSSVVAAGIQKANAVRNKAAAADTADLRSQKPTTEKDAQALYVEAQKKAQAAAKRVEPEIQKLRVATKKEVMSILTPQERAKWAQLLGKPFHPA